MLLALFLVVGSTALSLQQTTRVAEQTDLTTYEPSTADDTLTTLATTVVFAVNPPREVASCKNQLLCIPRPKSTFSKGFPPVPSKNLVPPFTDSELEGLTTPQTPGITLTEAETESVLSTTLFSASSSVRVPKSPADHQGNNDQKFITHKADASNDIRSYLPPSGSSSAPSQVDLSYLPPNGVLPAAASLDVSRVNFLDASAASPRDDAALKKPGSTAKDICSDAFHSFLCTPLRERKRITGALPGQSSQIPFRPEASNTVQYSAATATTGRTPSSPPTSSTAKSSFVPNILEFSATIDKSYLPPVPKVADVKPSINSIAVVSSTPSTTFKSFSASSPLRPYQPPKFSTITTVKPSETSPLFTSSSNPDKSYLPPISKTLDARPSFNNIKIASAVPSPTFNSHSPSSKIIPTTTTVKPSFAATSSFFKSSSNPDRGYLPPVSKTLEARPSFNSIKIASSTPSTYKPSTSAPLRASQPSSFPTTTTANKTPSKASTLFQSTFSVDRSYLPPATQTLDAKPSFNSVQIANFLPSSTLKPFSTSTPRPFIHTSIIPFLSPKVVEHLTTTKSATPKTVTTVIPKTEKSKAKTPKSLTSFSTPLNEVVDRGYLPPAPTKVPPQQVQLSSLDSQQKPKPPSVQIITEATKVSSKFTNPSISPSASTSKARLPQSTKLESAAAAQVDQAVRAPTAAVPEHHHHNHDDHHHHGKDICSDPFHSFLCAPLKQRKRITGALPPGFKLQSTNRKEYRVKPDVGSRAENSFLSERRVKPTDKVPAADSVVPQITGYQYPKPTFGLPITPQISNQVKQEIPQSTSNYSFSKPTNPLPLPSRQNVQIISNEISTTPPSSSFGYNYPKPTIPFPLPSESRLQQASTTPSPKPSTTPATRNSHPKSSTLFPLPSQQSTVVRPQPTSSTGGYSYPKPSKPFPLPSQQSTVIKPKPTSSTAGYTYPKPSTLFPLPSQQSTVIRPQPTPSTAGYTYPKPSKPFPLPSQQSTVVKPKPTSTTGYTYPKPSTLFPLPSQQSTVIRPQPTSSTGGYSYPKPSKPFPLPSQQATVIRPQPTSSTGGYSYPKPSKPFPLPTQQSTVIRPQTTASTSGSIYPKPSASFPQPSTGYRYPKPQKQFLLPTETNSESSFPKKPTLQSLSDLGSAEFIPVNKIDAKRQAQEASAGAPRFGDRITKRVKSGTLLQKP